MSKELLDHLLNIVGPLLEKQVVTAYAEYTLLYGEKLDLAYRQ